MKKIIGSMTILIAITLACYAHAGMYDRYLEMMDVLYAVLKTIFVSQVLVFLLIKFCRFKIAKRIRMRLLLLSKRLCMNWWINIIAAWAFSSFVLTSYWYVFSEGLFILAIIPLFLFWLLYSVVVFRKKLRVRWLSGLKPIYFYLIASIGQLLVFVTMFIAEMIMLYGPRNEMNKYLWGVWDIYFYKAPPFYFGDYFLAKGMLLLSAFLAIPYLLLATHKIFKFLINNKT
jgi:hypothetical protein